MRNDVSIRSRGRVAGFTLIELVVAMAMVAILASIGMPSYQNYARRGQLADAFTSLADMRVKMEQYYQDNKFYGTATQHDDVRHAAGLRGVSGLQQVLHRQLRRRCRAVSDLHADRHRHRGPDHRLRVHAESGRYQGHDQVRRQLGGGHLLADQNQRCDN